MRKTLLSLAVIGPFTLPLLDAIPASAQATRTWVSGVGDDANPCSRTAPCKTFAGAISKTFINGEINCLDPGGYGTVTITKSITIDCHEIFASILASGTNGININVAAGNANDPLRTVRLRNLNINGTGASGTVGTRTGLVGINIISAAAVFIEDMLVTDFTQQGIKDARNGAGELFISNTTVRNNTGGNIDIRPIGGGALGATLDRVTTSNAGSFGVRADGGGQAAGTIEVEMVNSVSAGNGTNGYLAVSSSAPVHFKITRSSAHNNAAFGAVASGAQAFMIVGNSSLTGNATGLAQQSSATVGSYTNNDVNFNTTNVSGTITAIPLQ